MKAETPCILAVNLGSSSLRFGIYQASRSWRCLLSGKIECIGLSPTTFSWVDTDGRKRQLRRRGSLNHSAAETLFIDWIRQQPLFARVRAIGHRVVHGMHHNVPEEVTTPLLRDLRRICPYDPDHLPQELQFMQELRKHFRKLPQVACFDTAFHRDMPPLARRLPLPRRYADKGVERYGFHGLSYAFLLSELRRLDPRAAKGRIIFAHLGNGSSLSAVHKGKPVDTSMGFTPAAGLVMSTRTGDLDPGVQSFLSRTEKMTPGEFDHMINSESGLLGVSATSGDVRDLLAREKGDPRAAEALALYCYQVKKWIGAYAAALGGLDTLVFAGGIGENAPVLRKRILSGLEFLGVSIDSQLNDRNAPCISKSGATVRVRIIATHEELMVARASVELLRQSRKVFL